MILFETIWVSVVLAAICLVGQAADGSVCGSGK
jgi:hypothetical protein